jgi:hypothetical protein
MDDRYHTRSPWIPWAVSSFLLVLVGVVAYHAGASGAPALADGDRATRAWAFHPFAGLWFFFVLFWILGGLRWFWWGGFYRPWHGRRYYDPSWYGPRDDWEAWHRREHERMERDRLGSDAAPDRAPR